MNEPRVQSHDDRLAQLPQAPAPPTTKRTWRFRKSWLALPLAVAGTWLYFAIDPGWRWERVVARFGAAYRSRITALAVLGVVLLALVAVVAVIHHKGKEES